MKTLVELLEDSDKLFIVMQNLTSYVIYLYPGVISMWEMSFLNAKTSEKMDGIFIIKIFSIGYIYNVVMQKVMPYESNEILYNLFLILVAIVVPYVWFNIKYSSFLEVLCKLLGIRTSISSVPFELLKNEGEKSIYVKVYLKNNNFVYIGFLKEYEYEEGQERFIIVSNYRKCIRKNNGNERDIEDHRRKDEKVYIKYQDIMMIEKIGEARAKCDFDCPKG